MILENNPEIEVIRSSDMAYEKLTVEIYYKGEPIAQINQDKGKMLLNLNCLRNLTQMIWMKNLL